MKPNVCNSITGAKTTLPVRTAIKMDIQPYKPKNISSRLVLLKGKAYSLCFHLSPFFIIPNFGVLKNSFVPPATASNIAIVLLTEIPVAKNIKYKYCFAFSCHLFGQRLLMIYK